MIPSFLGQKQKCLSNYINYTAIKVGKPLKLLISDPLHLAPFFNTLGMCWLKYIPKFLNNFREQTFTKRQYR